ncbi:hypothetical protein AAC387_Pa03g4446 [Persea americana]
MERSLQACWSGKDSLGLASGRDKRDEYIFMFLRLEVGHRDVRIVRWSRFMVSAAVDTYVDVELWCAISAVIVSIPQMDSEEILGSLGDFTQVVTVAAPTCEASNITVELLKCSSR